MAQSKEFFTRIQHKHDIEANWSKAVNFVPLNGEIIVYDKDDTHDYARIKIGDGVTKINELHFMLNDSVLYTEQILVDEQKRQARTNINAYGFDWHSLGQYRGYVANIEGKDSITDWETLLSVPSSTTTGVCAFAVLAQAIDNLLDGDDKNKLKYNIVQHFNSAMSDLISAGFSLSNYRFVFTKDIGNTNKYRFIWLWYIESKDNWVISDENESLVRAVHITSGTITFDNTLTYTDTTLSIADRTADAKAVGDALATKADAIHDHVISNVDGLQTALDAKAAASDVTALQELVGDTAVSTQITNATEFPVVTASSSDGIAYTATVSQIASLTAGAKFIMIPNKASASKTPTLNVNGLGAKNLGRKLSNMSTVVPGYSNSWISASKPYIVIYDGTNWVVEGQNQPVAADLYGTVASATKATQDGSGNVITDTYVPIKRSYVGQSSSTTTNPWYKFGYCKLDSGTFLDRTISFKVSQGFGDNTTGNGILTAHIRTGALGVVQNAQLVWEYANSGINTANFVLAYKVTADTCVEVELWAKQDVAYAKYHFEVISEHCRNEWTNDWTLYTADTAGQAASITDGWTQVVSQCAILNNPISAMGGCWISFTDENGNPTDEPFVHWYE